MDDDEESNFVMLIVSQKYMEDDKESNLRILSKLILRVGSSKTRYKLLCCAKLIRNDNKDSFHHMQGSQELNCKI